MRSEVVASLRVLLVEDNPTDAEIVCTMLARQGCVAVDVAETLNAAVQRAATGTVDVVLLDLSLPDSNGIETFYRFREQFDDLPVIILTGNESDGVIAQSARGGAQDYFVKGSINGPGLAHALRYAIDRAEAERALRESEMLLRASLDALAAHIAVLDENGEILLVNKAWRDFALANASSDINVGVGVNYLETCDRAASGGDEYAATFAKGMRSVLAGATVEFSLEYPCHSPNVQRWFTSRVTRFAHAFAISSRTPGKKTRLVVSHENITGRRLAEERLRLSEERFRLAARAFDGVIYDYDLAAGYVHRSENMVNLIGYRVEQVEPVSSWWTARIHPDDQERHRENIRAAMKSRMDYDLSYRIRRRDESYAEVWDRGIILRDDAGQPVRIVGTTVDVSGRVEAERIQRETEGRFLGVFHSDIFGVAFVDRDGNLTQVNELFARLAGRKTSDFQTQTNLRDVTAPEFHERDSESLQELFQQGRCLPYEKQLLRPDGTRTWVLVTGGRLPGNHTHGIRLVLDISGRKREEHVRAVLSQCAQSLSTATTADEVATALFASADQLFKWDAGYVSAYEPDATGVRFIQMIDMINGRRSVVKNAYMGPPSELIRDVVMNGSRLFLRGRDALPHATRFGDQTRRSESMMLVPIPGVTGVVGVLSIQSYSSNAFTARDLENLQMLGHYCAGAMVRTAAEEKFRHCDANADPVS